MRPSQHSWGSTLKSVEKSNFFQQVPIILRAFWLQILLSCILLVSGPFDLPACQRTHLSGCNDRGYHTCNTRRVSSQQLGGDRANGPFERVPPHMAVCAGP